MQHIVITIITTTIFIAVSTVRSGTTVAAMFSVGIVIIVRRTITIIVEFVFGSFWRFSYNHFSDVLTVMNE